MPEVLEALKHGTLLSQEQVNQLPEGTIVNVNWPGHPKPHPYEIGRYPGARAVPVFVWMWSSLGKIEGPALGGVGRKVWNAHVSIPLEPGADA